MDGSKSPWVIVAIPKKNDPVWKVSSEKIPHLTMLHLGSPDLDVERTSEFLKHVVDITLHQFSLEVDQRGTLGEEEADVLFFTRDYMISKLENVRSHLLTNPDISKAYKSSFQYPSWTPHLTLGYPNAPAKTNETNYQEIHWVQFGSIALWNGDYKGPEFRLKGNVLEEVAMSDTVDGLLAHYGVKGMKWGVRSSQSQLSADSEEVAQAKKTKAQIKSNRGSTDSISNKDLQNIVNRMNLEQQYSRLARENSNSTKGDKVIKDILAKGKTANDIYAFMNSPLAKLIRKSLIGV
jgi:2'-5' RNA ligase